MSPSLLEHLMAVPALTSVTIVLDNYKYEHLIIGYCTYAVQDRHISEENHVKDNKAQC